MIVEDVDEDFICTMKIKIIQTLVILDIDVSSRVPNLTKKMSADRITIKFRLKSVGKDGKNPTMCVSVKDPLNVHHRTKIPPRMEESIAIPSERTTISQPLGREEGAAAEGLEGVGEPPLLLVETEFPFPCEGGTDVAVVREEEAEEVIEEIEAEEDGVGSEFVSEFKIIVVDDGLLLTAVGVALGGCVVEDKIIDVPEIKNPFPIVVRGTQDDDDGAGCAGGVTGCP